MTISTSPSKGEVDREIQKLKETADNLKKLYDMTIEHDKKLLKEPKGHLNFGKYEMT